MIRGRRDMDIRNRRRKRHEDKRYKEDVHNVHMLGGTGGYRMKQE